MKKNCRNSGKRSLVEERQEAIGVPSWRRPSLRRYVADDGEHVAAVTASLSGCSGRRCEVARRVIATTIVMSSICVFGGCGVQAPPARVAVTVTSSSANERVAATRIFVVARLARARAIEAGLVASQAAVERYVSKTDSGCPRVAVGSPRSVEFDQLSHDALVSVGVTLVEAGPLTHFALVTGRLGWGPTPLTPLVRRLAEEERALARVVPFDICAVLASWVKSGYRRIPATATRFQRQIGNSFRSGATRCQRVPPSGRYICSLWALSTVAKITRLLERYEDDKERKMTREADQIESKLATYARATLTAAASALTRDLGLDSFSLRLFDASLGEP